MEYKHHIRLSYTSQCVAYRAIVAVIFLLFGEDWGVLELFNDICETEKYLPTGIL